MLYVKVIKQSFEMASCFLDTDNSSNQHDSCHSLLCSQHLKRALTDDATGRRENSPQLPLLFAQPKLSCPCLRPGVVMWELPTIAAVALAVCLIPTESKVFP